MPLHSRSTQDADACARCLAGMHTSCLEDPCCCGGDADLDTFFKHLDMEEQALVRDLRAEYGLSGADSELEGLPGAQPAKPKGDSGYIHPAAWPSEQDIGSFTDPKSTGRKRQARMYPIQKGQVCEWAGKIVTIGGLPVVVGCINSPATDLHHGPDKNTLNNEKVTAGVGTHENTHVICSDCHNSLHAKHDEFYPEYDRVAQQGEPWLPSGVTLSDQYQLEEAPLEQLYAEETRRQEDRKRRGRITRGRQARTIEEGDHDVRSEG